MSDFVLKKEKVRLDFFFKEKVRLGIFFKEKVRLEILHRNLISGWTPQQNLMTADPGFL